MWFICALGVGWGRSGTKRERVETNEMEEEIMGKSLNEKYPNKHLTMDETIADINFIDLETLPRRVPPMKTTFKTIATYEH